MGSEEEDRRKAFRVGEGDNMSKEPGSPRDGGQRVCREEMHGRELRKAEVRTLAPYLSFPV